MNTNISNQPENTCDCCGDTIQFGDLVYDGGDFYIHDECFFDYMRMFVLENGWRQYIYGDDDMD